MATDAKQLTLQEMTVAIDQLFKRMHQVEVTLPLLAPQQVEQPKPTTVQHAPATGGVSPDVAALVQHIHDFLTQFGMPPFPVPVPATKPVGGAA